MLEMTFQPKKESSGANPTDIRNNEIKNLKYNLCGRLLTEKGPIMLAFPPGSEVLLSHVYLIDKNSQQHLIVDDDVKKAFDEYFAFRIHRMIPYTKKLNAYDLTDVTECTAKWHPRICEIFYNDADRPEIFLQDPKWDDDKEELAAFGTLYCCFSPNKWPLPWSLNPSCIALEGKRCLPKDKKEYIEFSIHLESSLSMRNDSGQSMPDGSIESTDAQYFTNDKKISFKGFMDRDIRDKLFKLCHLFKEENKGEYLEAIDTLYRGHYVKRLFIGDLIWLFYFERMGIFKILGVILDDYATKGKIPMSNDSLSSLVMETMIRQIKMGLFSTVRDRDSSYRRCLGWTSDLGRKLGSEAKVNGAFNNLFHKFLQGTLEYYKDRRLATAIQAQTVPGRASVATLTTIGDTINVLKKSFDPFDYGRNCSNTLSGIIWVIAGLALIRGVRASLGIPSEYDEPYEYIPAAYDLLVLNKSISTSESNRYMLHKECAIDARDILLDIEVLNTEDPLFARQGGELEIWLDSVEDRIEGYRTAYRSLIGIDIGAAGTPVIEQQV